MAYSVEQLIAIGGNRWQKSSKDRVYFNDLASWYGLKVDTYKSGNISDAWLDGERISNSRAKRIATDLMYGKIYYDVIDGKWYRQNLAQGYFDEIFKAIKAKLAELPTNIQAVEPTIPEGYVKADCGCVIPKGQLMNANLGQICIDHYDRWSN